MSRSSVMGPWAWPWPWSWDNAESHVCSSNGTSSRDGGVVTYRTLNSPYFHANLDLSRSTGRSAGIREYYFEPNEYLPQYCTEAVLRSCLSQLPSITTLFGWTAERAEQDDRLARVSVVPSSGGAVLLSCDRVAVV
jgi:hypothetical protein